MTDDTDPVNLLRRSITSVIVIALVLVGAVAGFKRMAAMRKDSARGAGGALAPLVRTVTARRADYTESLRGFGRARPLRTATVVAEVEGIVRTIEPALEAGSLIERLPGSAKGGSEDGLPVLVVIDDRDLDDRLERARSDVTAADAEVTRLGTQLGSLRERLTVTERELEAAQRELDRVAKLVPQTLTQSDLDAQELQVGLRERAKLLLQSEIRQNADAVAGAQARLAALRRGVALAERAKARARVRAPFAGRVEARHVEVGERVKPGDPLFTVVDLSRVEVPVALPAGRYADVRPGAAATLRHPETETPLWTGEVARVAPAIDTERRIFFAYLVVEGTPGANAASPGAHLLATVAGRTHEGVIAIPRRALLGDRVFVAVPGATEGQATVVERTPRVIRYLAGHGLVREGLEEGDQVLVTNLESVAEGSRVRVDPEADAGASR